MSFESYAVRLRATFYIDGERGPPQAVVVPIDGARGTFEANAIPFCILSVPVGRDAVDTDNPASVSPAHWLVRRIRVPDPVVVEMKVTPLATDVGFDVFPSGWFTVFLGRIAAFNVSQSPGNTGAVVQLVHWLADMDFSSIYSEMATPNAPLDFLFPATVLFKGAGGAGGLPKLVGPTGLGAALPFLNSAAVPASDFWETGATAGLRPFLLALASEQVSNWGQVKAFVQNSEASSNAIILGALARFEPLEGILDYNYGVPITIRQNLADSVKIAQRLAWHVSQAAMDGSLAGASMWDRLVGHFLSPLLLQVVPMVERALVVPYNPWLRRHWVELTPSDYDMAEESSPTQRPLRAVIMTALRGSQSGLVDNSPRQPQNPLFPPRTRQTIGYFESTRYRRGLVMPIEPPPWINDLAVRGLGVYSAPASGKISTAMLPAAYDPFGGLTALLQAELSRQTTVALANEYCKAVYLQEVCRHRQAVVSSRLRFDVAPGSILKLQGATDRFVTSLLDRVGKADDLEDSLYGQVVRVTWSVTLQGNQCSAGTSFHVASLRTSAENTDDSFSGDTHPLWENTWSGAPLTAG